MRKKSIVIFALIVFAVSLIFGFQPLNVAYAEDTSLTTNLVLNGGGSGIGNWTDESGQGRWSTGTKDATFAAPATEGSTFFYLYSPNIYAGSSISAKLSQQITLAGTEGSGLFSNIDAGKISINFSMDLYQSAVAAGIQGKAIVQELDAYGGIIRETEILYAGNPGTGIMSNYKINSQISSGTRGFKILLSGELAKGSYVEFDNVSLKLVDSSSNTAPTISNINDGETYVGQNYGPISFTVNDANAADVAGLVLTAHSSKNDVIPASNISFGGTGTNRTFTIVPLAGKNGEADITITVSDGTKNASETFHINVQKNISLGTNLVTNGDGANGLEGWTGSATNFAGSAEQGLYTINSADELHQDIDMSKYSTIIDEGLMEVSASAITTQYGRVEIQFYRDIACTSAVGTQSVITSGTPSIQRFVPSGAQAVRLTIRCPNSIYAGASFKNIQFMMLNNFPKIGAVTPKTTGVGIPVNVPVIVCYTGSNATLTATSGNTELIPNENISVSGSGYNRTVTITPAPGKTGSATINLSAVDGASNVSSSFSISVVAPATVASVSNSGTGKYAEGNNLDFTVSFDNPITGGADSSLPITIGGSAKSASHYSQTANNITYRYTVAAEDAGTVAIGSAVTMGANLIKDAAGNTANGNIANTSTGIVVVKAPVVTSDKAGNAAKYGETITFTATFNSIENLAGTVQFKVNGINFGNPVTVADNKAAITSSGIDITPGSIGITAQYNTSGASYKFSSLTSAQYDLTLNKKQVSIAGLTGVSRIYDGTNIVELTGGAIQGQFNGADITANIPNSGTAANKAVGTNKAVSFDEITLTGNDAIYYEIGAQPAVTVTITAKPVTLKATVADKTYDGTTTAAVSLLTFNSDDICTGDDVSAAATAYFQDKNVGTTVGAIISGYTVTGSDKDNYLITTPTGITASINALNIEITPNAATKSYGQPDPVLTYSVSNGNLIGSETLAGNLSRVAGETVGEYLISQGTINNENNPNYNISFKSGAKLEITKVSSNVVSVGVPDNGTYKAGQKIQFKVTFSENVTISDGVPYLSLNFDGGQTVQADYKSGSGTALLIFEYEIVSGNNDSDGITVGTLNLNGAKIRDIAMQESVTTLNGVGATTGILIDTTSPEITGVTVPDNGNYKTGSKMEFSVSFNENVNVNISGGTPYLPITIGSETVNAVYTTGSGATIKFVYTVKAGDSDANGISVGTAINLNNGLISDTVGNDAVLDLNNVDVTSLVKVDTAKPNVTSVAVPANGTYKAGENLNFIVSFDETVLVAGIPSLGLELNKGGTPGAVYISGSGSQNLTFSYEVVAGNEDKNGITIGAIVLNGGSIEDSAGNSADVSLNNVGNSSAVLVDALGPIIKSSTIAPDNSYIDVTFDEGVYGSNNGATPLTAPKFKITITSNGGIVTDAAIFSVKKNDGQTSTSASAIAGGETTVRIFLTLTGGVSSGLESIEIMPTDGTSIYDIKGNPMAQTATTGQKKLNNNVPARNSGGVGKTAVNPTTPPNDVDVVLKAAATIATTIIEGQSVTTVTVDSGKLQDLLRAEQNGGTVTLSVPNNTDIATGIITGDMVSAMEKKEAVLVVKTSNATYELPASEINIVSIAKQLGEGTEQKDIKVEITIAEPKKEDIKLVENAAKAGEYSVVVPPMEFTVTCSANGKSVQVSEFTSYVERTIVIPAGVDPSKVTTGIVINPDGTTYSVPTKIVDKDGKKYVVINSLTNSIYAVVWNPVSFNDISKHWAKKEIEDMGSRMIISGVGKDNFGPNNTITRAEFAAIMVRALGLKIESNDTKFTDVNDSSWYSSYIKTAAAYGIINGYSDGTFNPQGKITREQAMTIIAKSMKITDLDVSVSSVSSGTLARYTDAPEISNYALSSVVKCLDAKIVSGRTAETIAPKENVTRAETVVMIRSLLKKSNLI